MSTNMAKHFAPRGATPQSQPIPGADMVQNAAGAYVFAVSDWDRLDRFLIMGVDGGSYYATERVMTLESAEVVKRCLAANGPRTVQRIVEISLSGRAPKNDQAIFALAMAASFNHEKGDKDAAARDTRHMALESLSKVCRIGTHLFQFQSFVKNFRGWGKGLRKAVGRWYTGQHPAGLATNVVKYQSREGFSHRDMLRLAHVQPQAGSMATILNWAVKGWPDVGEHPHPDRNVQMIWAFEKAKRTKSSKDICRLIRDYKLPRECVPTEFLREKIVWDALLEHMPPTALIRNLGKMTNVGLIEPLSQASRLVQARLQDQTALEKARVHPIAPLLAGLTYASGRGIKGSLTWAPVPQVVDACENAFYLAFKNVPTTGKNWLLALDVSGSMAMAHLSACPAVTARVASAAMALVTANSEPDYAFLAFTAANGTTYRTIGQPHDAGVTPLSISPKQRIQDVCRTISGLNFGGTDCALPMLHAMERKMPVDVFVIYTDNESWAGKIHAKQALDMYRQKMGRPAKAICVAMTATSYSVLDPNDANSLQVVGFDANAPAIMSGFVSGNIATAAEDEAEGEEA